MKKFICAAAVLAVGISSAVSFGGCKPGEAYVQFTLSEDGTYYIVSGVSGDKRGLKSYDVPATYSAEDGGEMLPVKEIGYEAFFQCYDLAKITLPDCIEKIGERAFAYCSIRAIEIPDGVKTINYAAFGMCTSITEITIPRSVEKLDDLAFYCCSSLEKAVILANITELGDSVFYNPVYTDSGNTYTHSALKEVYLPSTLQKINKTAFYGNAINNIYFSGTKDQWDAMYFYEKVDKDGETIENRVEQSAAISTNVKITYAD